MYSTPAIVNEEIKNDDALVTAYGAHLTDAAAAFILHYEIMI